MPLCGYHPKMGKGIEEFAEGLITSLRDKAERLDLSMSKQMEAEAEELNTLSSIIATRLSQEEECVAKENLRAWNGLVHLVQYLMQPESNGALSRADFELAVRKRATDFDASMVRFEDAFEENLELPLRQRLDLALDNANS